MRRHRGHNVRLEHGNLLSGPFFGGFCPRHFYIQLRRLDVSLVKPGYQALSRQSASRRWAPAQADALARRTLLAAVVSSASDMARPPLAVVSLALLLMLFRRGLDVTMIRSCLPPCEGWG